MNFKTTFLLLAVLSVTLGSVLGKAKRDDDDEQTLGSLAWETVLSVVAPIAVGGISEMFGSIFKPNAEKEQTILGRPMKVKICEDAEFCIEITDEWSGTITTGTGNSHQEAIGDATKQMYEELLKKGKLSLQDLCDLHIIFPHPDKDNCQDININPCDLIHPVVTTPKPCVDSHGRYCVKNKDRCTQALFASFMMENCYKTCTDGKCGASSDPCKL